jgi:hypothetical protein
VPEDRDDDIIVTTLITPEHNCAWVLGLEKPCPSCVDGKCQVCNKTRTGIVTGCVIPQCFKRHVCP